MERLKMLIVTLTLFLPAMVMTGELNAQSRSDLFVFRTQKKLLGAKVEIFSDEGELLTTHTVQKRKMIVDFRDATSGTYTIKVSKGELVREFQYTRKENDEE